MSDVLNGEPEHYRHVVRFVAETPWAILPSTLASITDFVRLRSEGHRLSEEEIQARIGGGQSESSGLQVAGGVAVLPIYGVISPRATLLSQISGGTSVESLRSQLRTALADPSVNAIVLDVHSPGGAVDGVPELAAELRAARGQKPIVAVANTLMASAAYWLASQADEVVASPTALVGSIGVITSHQDLTAAAEQAGVKTTIISAGKYKAEGNPFEPLSDEAKAAVQQQVDDAYGMFVDDVAKGRKVSADTVRNSYGEGRAIFGSRAKSAGLVDSVATLEETVARLASRPSSARRGGRTYGSFQKAQRALPALATGCSKQDALYSMALLMGGRGAAAFTDLPDVDHRELYERVVEAYEHHGLEPPEYDREPVYDNVAFRHDEREVFADRYLRKSLATVTVGATGFRGALSAETADAARAAVRELTALLERAEGSTAESIEKRLSALADDLRRATDLLKGA